MKNFISSLLALVLYFYFSIDPLQAQETETSTVYLVVTKRHFKPDSKKDNWEKDEKEYFDKVTSKNEYILHTEVLKHLLTNDNTEVLFLNVYKNWCDIEKATERTQELEDAVWTDENSRNSFFEKLDGYYTDHYSDEIYKSYSQIKNFKIPSSVPLIVYIKNSELNLSGKEGLGFLDFVDKVILKDTTIKGYYTFSHSWGSNSTDFLEAFYYNSLADLEKSHKEMDNLIKNAWPNENDRKTFFEGFDRYFTGKHKDFIYTNVPSLTK